MSTTAAATRTTAIASLESEGGRANPISLSDEADLRIYFSRFRPSAPGDRSNFGAVAARMMWKRPPDSPQRPTPGTPWTELVECASARAVVNFDGEEAMLAHLDARWRFRRVSEALSRLSVRDQEVLDAYYSGEPTEHALGQLSTVACLTQTAQRRNRARAARGLHEPTEATVRWLAAATSPEGRAASKEINAEACAMLSAARGHYAHARARVGAARQDVRETPHAQEPALPQTEGSQVPAHR
jgi:hypothetical protein